MGSVCACGMQQAENLRCSRGLGFNSRQQEITRALKSRVLLLFMLWAQQSLALPAHTCALSEGCALRLRTTAPHWVHGGASGSIWEALGKHSVHEGCAFLLRVTQQPGTEPSLGRSDFYRLWWYLLPDVLLHPKRTSGASNLSAEPLFCRAFPQRT